MKELKLFDEQKIKKMKKAVAAGALFMTLGCGAAQAMPTGGQVEVGGVNVTQIVSEGVTVSQEVKPFAAGQTINELSSGATITVTGGPTIIDWKTFDVVSGTTTEALYIDTSGGALLNKVSTAVTIGTILEQRGSNPCWIVSPAGISVGENAEITASNLVLSALSITNDDFMAIANGTKKVDGLTSAGPEPQGGRISFNSLTVGPGNTEAAKVSGHVTAYASSIQLAEGIVIEAVEGTSFIFSDGELLPEPVQEAATTVSNVLTAATESVTGQNAAPVVMEGNTQPGATAPASEPAAVDNMVKDSFVGIGQIENGQYNLGEVGDNANEDVAFVGVGDVNGAVTMNVWDNSSGSAGENTVEGTGAENESKQTAP